MRSAVAVTKEIDDLEIAVDELVSKIKEQIEIGRASVAIVLCDPDVLTEELGSRLHEALGCDILGATATAVITRPYGMIDIGITIVVFTGDDVSFRVASTGPLTPETFDAEIRSTYRAACADAGTRPKMIILGAPSLRDITADRMMAVLDDEAGHVPIFGAVASDHYDYDRAKTFRNGESSDRALQVLTLFGDVEPIFSVRQCMKGTARIRGVITKSEHNRVYEIDGKPFIDFLSETTSIPNTKELVYYFQSMPFVIAPPDLEEGEQPLFRILEEIDPESGAGIFPSEMPEGSDLSARVMTREMMIRSCEETLETIFEKIRNNPNYEYSMIFTVSCNTRLLMLGSEKKMEMEKLHSMLQEHFGGNVNDIGFYSYGEICPTIIRDDGSARNRMHSITFAVCAL